jgi:hypothetical protein
MSLGSISPSRTRRASARDASTISSRPPYDKASVSVIPVNDSVSEVSAVNFDCARSGNL